MTKPALSGHKRGCLFLAFLAFIAIAVLSCKKDLFDQSRKEHSNPDLVKRNAGYRKGPQMEKVSFNNFRAKTDLNVLGNVGKMLTTANPKAKTMAVNTPETYEGLQINTDSVTIIKNGDRTSYIFSVKLSNHRAIVFQNLTVDVTPERTLTFINTYAPTQKWIARWRSGNPGEFEGNISVTYLKSASTGLPGIGAASPNGELNKNSTTKVMGGAVKPGTSGKTSMVYQDCYTTTYYYITPYTCTGDHHWPWEECRMEGDDRAGWRISSKDITDCYEYDDGIGSGGGAGGGSGGGGGTSPSTPPDYDPCDTTQPPTGPIQVHSGATGAKLMVHQVPDCNGNPPPVLPPVEPVFDENEPIILPLDFEIGYPLEYYDDEAELDALALLFVQENAPLSSMIPEMYYKNGVRVDMVNAPVKGRTALGHPRNATYFWKQVIEQKPQMFSSQNRQRILSNPSKMPIVDAQWIKYNPTHKNFLNEPLHHHHEGQGRYAYAIPRKVHQKWTSILHEYRRTGKIPGIRPKINGLLSVFQVFTLFTDIQTGNPDAWINWFGPHQDVGKLYKLPEKNVYFEITQQVTTKDNSGKIIKAVVTYDVYDDYIWDEDEKRYMGVIKLGTFTEYINLETNTTYDRNAVWH
ncbi:hypothetical protein [Pedobacter sp.]|uniref:hypothetical protein n=1 Tax=Pedobacter sp. TaxID=1411316 RepID=UPI00396CFEF6